MQFHLDSGTPVVNGVVNGRGVKRLTRQGRIARAADVATRVKRLEPSLGQICTAFDISPVALRRELKARAARAKANGNGSYSAKAQHAVQNFVAGLNGLSRAELGQVFQSIDKLAMRTLINVAV